MAQRNIDIDELLWSQVQSIAHRANRRRAEFVRDCVYTAVRAAIEGRPVTLYATPYASREARAAQGMALVRVAHSAEWTQIDVATGLTLAGQPDGPYEAVMGDPAPGEAHEVAPLRDFPAGPEEMAKYFKPVSEAEQQRPGREENARRARKPI